VITKQISARVLGVHKNINSALVNIANNLILVVHSHMLSKFVFSSFLSVLRPRSESPSKF